LIYLAPEFIIPLSIKVVNPLRL